MVALGLGVGVLSRHRVVEVDVVPRGGLETVDAACCCGKWVVVAELTVPGKMESLEEVLRDIVLDGTLAEDEMPKENAAGMRRAVWLVILTAGEFGKVEVGDWSTAQPERCHSNAATRHKIACPFILRHVTILSPSRAVHFPFLCCQVLDSCAKRIAGD